MTFILSAFSEVIQEGRGKSNTMTIKYFIIGEKNKFIFLDKAMNL